MGRSISRRQLLTGLGALAAYGGVSATLSACVAPAPQVVKETVVVEKVVTATLPAPTGPARLRLTMMFDPGEFEPFQAMLNQYNIDHPESEIVLEVMPWDGYVEKVVTQVAGGTAADLTFVHPTFVPFFAEQQVALPVDDLVQASPDFHPEDFPTTTCEYVMYKGKRYGFPNVSYPTVTYFNKTLFDKLGVPLPTEFMSGFENATDEWTWEKMLELAVQLTTGTGVDQTFGLSRGYGGVPSSLSHLCQIIFSYGGEVWNEDWTQTLLCEQAAIDAIKFQIELVTKYHVAPMPAEAEGIPGGVNSGRYGMWLWNRSEVAGFKNVDFELGMAPFPRGPKGRVLRDAPCSTSIITSTKYVKEAWQWCMHMSGPKPGELGGQRYQYEIQHSIPVRFSLFNNEVYLKNLLPWEDNAIFEDSTKRVRFMGFPPRFLEIDNLYREKSDAMLLGQATVEEALAGFCKEANELLKPA